VVIYEIGSESALHCFIVAKGAVEPLGDGKSPSLDQRPKPRNSQEPVHGIAKGGPFSVVRILPAWSSHFRSDFMLKDGEHMPDQITVVRGDAGSIPALAGRGNFTPALTASWPASLRLREKRASPTAGRESSFVAREGRDSKGLKHHLTGVSAPSASAGVSCNFRSSDERTDSVRSLAWAAASNAWMVSCKKPT
jgi:hypothetical protein